MMISANVSRRFSCFASLRQHAKSYEMRTIAGTTPLFNKCHIHDIWKLCSSCHVCKSFSSISRNLSHNHSAKFCLLCRQHACSYRKTALMLQNVRNSYQHVNQTLTFENIFDEENKTRLQKKLDKIQPVRKTRMKSDPRHAAVLIPMCKVKGQPALLYMKRSNHMKQHRGEVWYVEV